MSANSVAKIRGLFIQKPVSMTLNEINKELPELKPSDISMALCYLLKQRYLQRALVANTTPKERKSVWQYTYSQSKLPEVINAL